MEHDGPYYVHPRKQKTVQMRLDLSAEHGLRFVAPSPPRRPLATKGTYAPILQLPDEILCMVFEHLPPKRKNAHFVDADNVDDIFDDDAISCWMPMTTVCKWWNVLYDRVLYREINIRDHRTMVRLWEALTDRPSLFAFPRKVVFDICFGCCYYRETTILGCRFVAACTALRAVDLRTEFYNYLRPLLKTMCGSATIRTLCLGGYGYGPSAQMMLELLGTRQHGLREIRAYHYGYGKPHDLGVSIDRYRRDMGDAFLNEYIPPLASRLADPIICKSDALRSLTLRPGAPAVITKAILRCPIRLVTLTLDPSMDTFKNTYTTRAIEKMLALQSTSLEHLRLGWMPIKPSLMPNFSICSRLRVLSFKSEQLLQEPIGRELGKLALPHLRQLTVGFPDNNQSSIEACFRTGHTNWFLDLVLWAKRNSEAHLRQLETLFVDFRPAHVAAHPVSGSWPTKHLLTVARICLDNGVLLAYHTEDCYVDPYYELCRCPALALGDDHPFQDYLEPEWHYYI